ncbi:MAG: hypothetical protein WAV82_05320 [Methylobacter sp.]
MFDELDECTVTRFFTGSRTLPDVPAYCPWALKHRPTLPRLKASPMRTLPDEEIN